MSYDDDDTALDFFMNNIFKFMGGGVFLLAVFISCATCETFCNQSSVAQAEATAYLSRMRPNQPISVTCMPYDSDHNGYVSCDALVDGRPVALECGDMAGCMFMCNEGCKLRNTMQPGAAGAAQ